jgi:hypothetical protein
MNKETEIQRKIMLAISEKGHLVFRNETGNFWTGTKIHQEGNVVTLSNARMVKVGLCTGSSDIIGITRKGRFFAIEVKSKDGRASEQQKNFIKAIKLKNGIAGIAKSVEDALSLLDGE